jgi:hypothetical protein
LVNAFVDTDELARILEIEVHGFCEQVGDLDERKRVSRVDVANIAAHVSWRPGSVREQ